MSPPNNVPLFWRTIRWERLYNFRSCWYTIHRFPYYLIVASFSRGEGGKRGTTGVERNETYTLSPRRRWDRIESLFSSFRNQECNRRDPFVSRETLCSSIVSFAALRPYHNSFFSNPFFSFCDLTSSSLADSTRLDSTRLCPTLLLLSPGWIHFCPNKKTLNCCAAAYYEKSLGANSGICREKLLPRGLFAW